MPVLVGESCYEGHMQTAFQDVQRYVFWGCMLSGAAGQTYGAAGVWHASVEGDPGITPVYDFTTWREGMNYPGSTQVGLGKKLLEKYPWRVSSRIANGSNRARLPQGSRRSAFHLPASARRLQLERAVVKNLERDVPYSAFYFNPTNGKRYNLGTVVNAGPPPKPFEGHTQPGSSKIVSREQTPRHGKTTARPASAKTAIWSAVKAW